MPDPIDEFVGNAIKQIRISKRLSLTAVAEEVGVSFQQLQKYESATNRISASRLAKISRALDVPISDFFPSEYRGQAYDQQEETLLTKFRSSSSDQRQFLSKLISGL